MKTWIGWAVALVAAIGLVAVLDTQQVLDRSVSSVLFGVVVLVAGVGTKLLADRRRAAAREDADDGLERELARRAGAATFPVPLIAILLLGLWATVRAEWDVAVLCYLAAVLTVVVHTVVYARLRRQGT